MNSARARGAARALATLVVVTAIDQIAKQIVLHQLELGESVRVLPGLELTSTRNRGVAFGALQGKGGAVAILIGLALVMLIAFFVMHANRPLIWLPVGMLLGGALGNLLDRWRHGAVVDFVDPVLWPAFNLADASIVLGVPLLFYVVERRSRTDRPAADSSAG